MLPLAPEDETPDLSVSVVTYNSADCLEALLLSISAQIGVRWELFLVDNDSTDRTPDLLRSCSIAQVTLNAENIGYGKAHNQNRSRFRGRHVLFLNPDIVLPPNLFATWVKHLDATPAVGAAGPSVVEGPERTPFPPRRFYPGEGMIPLEPGLRRTEPAWIHGCCFAVRREVFEAVGGFDPDYFLYFEETDLCLRIRRAGYRIGWIPELEVWHDGRRSQAALSEYQKDCKLFSGLTVFWQKHYNPRDMRSMLRFQSVAAQLILVGGRLLPAATKFRAKRFRARRDVSRQWLMSHGFRLFPIDSRTWRILARALHLSFTWLMGGELDLDDF